MSKDKIKDRLLSNREIKPSVLWPEKFPNCWWWIRGRFNNGYGQTWAIDRSRPTHRVSAWIYELKDPEGNLFTLDSIYKVCHHCDNKLCFNPEHIWVGTSKENDHDAMKKNIKPMPPIHKGENGVTNVLTEFQVLEIRRLYILGNVTYKQLGVIYNVSKSCIQHIINRKHWSHI